MDMTELPNGVDQDDFSSLPKEMCRELLDEKGNLNTTQKKAFASLTLADLSRVDLESLSALPVDIQEEVSNTF